MKRKNKKFQKRGSSSLSKLSLFQKSDNKFSKKCPLSVKDAPVVDYKNISLLKSETYKMLINHLDNEIIEVFKSNNQYGFEVTILGNDKKYYKFQWVLERYYEEGHLKNCWLTTSVSSLVSLGSSI